MDILVKLGVATTPSKKKPIPLRAIKKMYIGMGIMLKVMDRL